MVILLFSFIFFAFTLLIYLTCWACSEIKNGGKEMKKPVYYIVESSKNTYVFHEKEKAVKKQNALLLTLREPISIQIMEQMSLDDYIKESKKKVTFNG